MFLPEQQMPGPDPVEPIRCGNETPCPPGHVHNPIYVHRDQHEAFPSRESARTGAPCPDSATDVVARAIHAES
jgi:hypothetical protein